MKFYLILKPPGGTIMKTLKLIFLTISLLLMTSFSVLASAGTPTSYVKDSAITADVKAKFLADSDIKSMHISVKTNKDGVVTLTGYVTSDDMKQKAVSIASGADGVKSVTDKLKVKKTKTTTTTTTTK